MRGRAFDVRARARGGRSPESGGRELGLDVRHGRLPTGNLTTVITVQELCEFSPGPEILQGCEFSLDAAKSPHMRNLTRTCEISLPAKSHLSEFS